MAFLAASSIIFYGCSKQKGATPNEGGNPENAAIAPHGYGLNPMTEEQWRYVPDFSEHIAGKSTGLSSSTVPSSFLLSSPPVRNQGQIGSCTGFCGAESNEILYYYKNVTSPVTSTSLDSSTALPAAVSTQMSGMSSLFGTSSGLSPLFIYYMERCIILGQSINTDAGAYMVNIPQVLQGLTNNTGTGKTLNMKIGSTTYTVKGDCNESSYPYPTSGLNTSTQFRTAPGSSAISNAAGFKIGMQSGTTGSSGTTSHGYFVINSTDPVVDVKIAIYNKKPVMMGFNVYDNSSYQTFEGLGMTGYAPNRFTYNPITASGSVKTGLSFLGGHAVPIIGYIDDVKKPGGGLIICENSWGTGWGYHGYFYMPYSVLRNKTIVPSGNLYVSII